MNVNMTELVNGLDERGIPYEIVIQPYGSEIVCVPCADRDICCGDFICNQWSYGHEHGLLEAMGFNIEGEGEGVEGFLTGAQALALVDEWVAGLRRGEGAE